jgi:hypothetical protein
VRWIANRDLMAINLNRGERKRVLVRPPRSIRQLSGIVLRRARAVASDAGDHR